MKIVAIGGRAFVAGLRLAGVTGIQTNTPDETLKEIELLIQDKDVGLILVSDDLAKGIRDKLTAIRAKRSIPLIFEVPAPGSDTAGKEPAEYRNMLKQILGV